KTEGAIVVAVTMRDDSSVRKDVRLKIADDTWFRIEKLRKSCCGTAGLDEDGIKEGVVVRVLADEDTKVAKEVVIDEGAGVFRTISGTIERVDRINGVLYGVMRVGSVNRWEFKIGDDTKFWKGRRRR